MRAADEQGSDSALQQLVRQGEVWALARLAEQGDMDALRDVAERALERGEVMQAWTWQHLALPHGCDLTTSTMQAYHDGGQQEGEFYDSDLGGPLYVDGVEALRLPSLDFAEDQQAGARSCEIYEPTLSTTVPLRGLVRWGISCDEDCIVWCVLLPEPVYEQADSQTQCSCSGFHAALAVLPLAATTRAGHSSVCSRATVSGRLLAAMQLLFRNACHWRCLAVSSLNSRVNATGGCAGSGVLRRANVAAMAWAISDDGRPCIFSFGREAPRVL